MDEKILVKKEMATVSRIGCKKRHDTAGESSILTMMIIPPVMFVHCGWRNSDVVFYCSSLLNFLSCELGHLLSDCYSNAVIHIILYILLFKFF